MEQTREDEKKWLKLVQIQVYTILTTLIPDKERRLKYVAAEPMKLWAKAFTFESYSTKFNYETVEFLGDKIAGAVFAKYILKRFPSLNESLLTELNGTYNSKETQYRLADRLKLTPLLRIVGLGPGFSGYTTEVPEKIKTDVYESFLGTLFEISDEYDYFGAGFVNCYNLTVQLYNDIPIDISGRRLQGDFKTQIQQLLKFKYDGIAYRQINDDTVEKGNSYYSSVSLTKGHQKLFQRLGKDVPLLLGEGKGESSRSASDKAYGAALDTLESFGITKEYINTLKENDPDEGQGDFNALFRQAEDVAAKNGYRNLEFHSFKKLNVTSTETLFLLGETEQGKEVTLHYITVSQVKKGSRDKDRLINNRKLLLKDYINSN